MEEACHCSYVLAAEALKQTKGNPSDACCLLEDEKQKEQLLEVSVLTKQWYYGTSDTVYPDNGVRVDSHTLTRRLTTLVLPGFLFAYAG